MTILEDLISRLNAKTSVRDKGKDKRIAVAGHFPFSGKLRDISKGLWVIEKNPREVDFPEDKAENLIHGADVVGITGTALTNHTLECLLELCHPKAYVVVVGASAPLSPILFEYGVDAISGTKVINNELAMRCVSQGANFRQIKGARRLTMMRG